MNMPSKMSPMIKIALKRKWVIFTAFSLSLLAPELAFSQWVFVARHAIGRIEQVTQNQSAPGQRPTEVVTVILDAPAQRVYEVAMNAIQKNQNVTINNTDPQRLAVQISQDSQVATLSVKPLSDDTSQLIIVGTSAPGQTPQTSRIVDGAMRICNELGKECKIAN